MRKSLLACVAAALVLVGTMIALGRPRHCPVNRAALERIEKGMTRAEVHAILGGPQGAYSILPVDYFSEKGLLPYSERWYGDRGTACIRFDHASSSARQTVTDMAFEESNERAPGPLDLASWRLRRMKNALFP